MGEEEFLLNFDLFQQELLEWARHLVLDKGTDAAALAFLGGNTVDPKKLRKLDLASLSSIHIAANGSVELKFIDKIKLIELLLSTTQTLNQPASDAFINAIDRAAAKLTTTQNNSTSEVDPDDLP